FQAEDGIRAFHVTGVQTCALPIFVDLQHPTRPSRRRPGCRTRPYHHRLHAARPGPLPHPGTTRRSARRRPEVTTDNAHDEEPLAWCPGCGDRIPTEVIRERGVCSNCYR